MLGIVFILILLSPLLLIIIFGLPSISLGIASFVGAAIHLDKSMLTIKEEQEMQARAHWHVYYIFLERYRHTDYWECHCGHVFSVYVD